MTFIAYNKETTIILPGKVVHYMTMGAAKAALTRAAKAGKIDREDYDVAEGQLFFATIEKSETKKNIFGKEFTQKVNTPMCCDPSTETYWSM